MSVTLADLSQRARTAIEQEEPFVYDVASESCQIMGNVAKMRWFRLAVMREIASTTKKYQHLAEQIPEV